AGNWGSGADAAAVASAAGPDHLCHHCSPLPHCCRCHLHRSQCPCRPHHHLHHLHHLHPHDLPHHRHLHRHPHLPCHPCRPCRCDASHWERKQPRPPQHQGS
ncbi:unnamed protein product, partial [Closterium sp. NIES-54]